jgi:integrase
VLFGFTIIYSIFEKKFAQFFPNEFMNSYVSLFLRENTLYLYTSKSGKVLRHCLHISISDFPPKDITSIGNHIKKKRFPPQLENYRKFIEKEQKVIDSIIQKYKEEFGDFPDIPELRKLIKGGDINLNSELVPIFREYLEIRRKEFSRRNSLSSLKDFVSFLNGILDMETLMNKKFNIRSINEEFLREYFDFLISKRELGKGFKTKGGLNARSIKKRFDVLKTFLKWLKEKKGVDRYTEITKLLKENSFDLERLKVDVKRFTLSVEQIKLISEFEIIDESSPFFKVRDMFLFCCFTGLRFSDLIKINKSNFIRESGGRWFLVGKAVKTSRIFRVDISERTFQIVSRNNFNLSLMTNQKANFYLKQLLGEMDEFRQDSEMYFKKNERNQDVPFKYYELVSFHTARRSFITTLLDKGFSIPEVMKRTGHSKATTIEQYVNPNEKMGRTIIDIFEY